MRTSFLFAAFLVIVSLCAVSRAHAQGAKDADADPIVVLAVDTDAEHQGLREAVQKSMISAIAKRTAVASQADTRLAIEGEADLVDCYSNDCLERIGDVLSASRFVRPIVKASGANYRIRLQLLDIGADSRLVASAADTCSVCTVLELQEMAAILALRLLATSSNEPPEPAGKSLAPANSSYEEPVTPAGHSETPMQISPPRRTLAWATAGASLSLLTLGTTLILFDERPACSSQDAQCKYRYDTHTGGVLSIAAGVATGALAGWLFTRPHEQKPFVRVLPGAGEVTAGIQGHF